MATTNLNLTTISSASETIGTHFPTEYNNNLDAIDDAVGDVVSDVSDLDTRLTTAESDISDAQSDIATAQSDISSLNTSLANSTYTVLNQDISGYLASGFSVSEYIRYSRYGRVVIVDIGGLYHSGTSAASFLTSGALPVLRNRVTAVVAYDSSSDATIVYEAIGATTLRIATHRSGVKYYATFAYLTDAYS